MIENHKRTIIKTITWRVLATLTTMSIVFAFTRRVVLSLEVGLVEVLAKMFLYYLHERLWGKVSWGKIKHPLSEFNLKKPYLSQEDKLIIETELRRLGYID